jgi:hypothetical protein
MAAELMERYRLRVVVWRDLFLFPADVALEFLNDCEHQEIRLLGCDAFEMPRGDTIRSRFEDNLDVSGKEYWDYSISELCDVIRDYVELRSGKLFEFTLP